MARIRTAWLRASQETWVSSKRKYLLDERVPASVLTRCNVVPGAVVEAQKHGKYPYGKPTATQLRRAVGHKKDFQREHKSKSKQHSV